MNKAAFKKSVPVVRINEWNTTVLEGVTLGADDRRLAKDLSATNRLEVEELRAGLRIRSKSWIGVVRLSKIEIQIHPKLSGDNVRVIEMIELTQGLDILKRMPGIREIDTNGKSLMDLLAMMLIHEAERLIRNGLLSDYVEQVDELPVLRGRILADRQVLKRFGRVDRVICQFDDRSQDIPENQVLAIGTQLCARFATDEAIRRKAREISHILRQTCSPSAFDVRRGDSQIVYNRMNAIYEDAHQLCWLIIRMCGVKDFYASSTITSFAFMLDMNRLFEEFVYKLVEHILDAKVWKVIKQVSSRSIVWNDTANRSYATVRPDIVLRHQETGRVLTIDAKYKLYDTKKINSADIYQSFLYAFGFHKELSQHLPQSILLFPASSTDSQPLDLKIRDMGRAPIAQVFAQGLPIPEAIDEVKEVSASAHVEALARLFEARQQHFGAM